MAGCQCAPRSCYNGKVNKRFEPTMGVRVCLLPLFLAFFTGVISAQVTGRISGSGADSSGAAMANATVNLLLPGGAKPVLTTVTTTEGLFSFTNVRPELYDLTIDSKGFQGYMIRGVKVDPARETSLPKVQLELASV